MELYSKIEEDNTEHYNQAFEALDELAAKISSAEFAGASFGDVEAEIHKSGMEVLRKMAQGYLDQSSSSEVKQDCWRRWRNSYPSQSELFKKN